VSESSDFFLLSSGLLFVFAKTRGDLKVQGLGCRQRPFYLDTYSMYLVEGQMAEGQKDHFSGKTLPSAINTFGGQHEEEAEAMC